MFNINCFILNLKMRMVYEEYMLASIGELDESEKLKPFLRQGIRLAGFLG